MEVLKKDFGNKINYMVEIVKFLMLKLEVYFKVNMNKVYVKEK